MKKILRIIENCAGLFIFLGLALGFGGSLGHILLLMVIGITFLLVGVVGLKVGISRNKNDENE